MQLGTRGELAERDRAAKVTGAFLCGSAQVIEYALAIAGTRLGWIVSPDVGFVFFVLAASFAIALIGSVAVFNLGWKRGGAGLIVLNFAMGAWFLLDAFLVIGRL